MWLIHNISENLILNQTCSQKFNNNENIHVDNNKIKTLEIMQEKGITVNSEDEKDEFQFLFKHIYNHGYFPEELIKSIFITLPKISGTTKYEKNIA